MNRYEIEVTAHDARYKSSSTGVIYSNTISEKDLLGKVHTVYRTDANGNRQEVKLIVDSIDAVFDRDPV